MNIVAVVGTALDRARRADGSAVGDAVGARVDLRSSSRSPRSLSSSRSRYPEQGGVYAWVRRAFGPGHGFICGWCLWVNNLFYFPSLLLFGAANFAAMGGAEWEALRAARWYSVAFVLAGIWIAAGINIIGLRLGKWLQNAGSARRLDSRRPADRARRVRARALVGSATSFQRGRDDPARRPARHRRPVVGDVLRVLGVRDHVARRAGGPRPAAHDSARHLHRRRR